MNHQFEEMINNGPSVVRNSVMITLVRVLSWITGMILLAGGVGLIISGVISGTMMEWLMPEKIVRQSELFQAEWNAISIVMGIAATFLGLLLLLMTRLAIMVLRRNGFILSLQVWWEDYRKRFLEIKLPENETQTN